MTVYVTCYECESTIPEWLFKWHACDAEDELPGYDPLEPWMDNDLS